MIKMTLWSYTNLTDVALGDLTYLSSNAAMLAQVELERGDTATAERWIEVAERVTARDDVDARFRVELARGLLLVERGDPHGERHLRAALSLADTTDSSVARAEMRLALARILGRARGDEATTLALEAIDLLEAKGATAYLDDARQLLAELEGSGPSTPA